MEGRKREEEIDPGGTSGHLSLFTLFFSLLYFPWFCASKMASQDPKEINSHSRALPQSKEMYVPLPYLKESPLLLL